MEKFKKHVEACYVVHCSPQMAYEWLYERRHTSKKPVYSFAQRPPDVFEYLLYRRRDPLIDLAIARFGRSPRIIKRVFKRGDMGTRCAALSNPAIGPEEPEEIRWSLLNLYDGWLTQKDLQKLIDTPNDAELQALAANPYINDITIEQLLKREGVFTSLSEAQYLKMLIWLGKNPRMCQPYDDRILDGWAEYTHSRVFTLAWELARTLPTNQNNAYVLLKLLQNTELPVGFENPEEVIARWQIDKANEDDESTGSLSHSFYLRIRLADLLPLNEDIPNSEDLAVRQSFYRRFSPWDWKNWTDFLEKDGENFFDAVVENDKCWQSEKRRNWLRDLSWDVPDPNNRMDAPNKFRAFEERNRKYHPEWFRNEAPLNDESLAIVRRLEKKIDVEVDNLRDHYSDSVHIEDKIEEIGQLLGQLEYEGSESLDKINSKLSALRDALYERDASSPQSVSMRSKIIPNWVWITAIILALLFLLKP